MDDELIFVIFLLLFTLIKIHVILKIWDKHNDEECDLIKKKNEFIVLATNFAADPS